MVNVYRNGTIEVVSGAQDIGPGYRTMIGDVVRTHLGLPRELLVVKVGRGDYPAGPASGGSVTSRATAPKAFVAAEMVAGRHAQTGRPGVGTRRHRAA